MFSSNNPQSWILFPSSIEGSGPTEEKFSPAAQGVYQTEYFVAALQGSPGAVSHKTAMKAVKKHFSLVNGTWQ